MRREHNYAVKTKFDKDFVQTFKPLHAVLSLFSLNKFRLQGGSIIKNSYVYFFTSIGVNMVVCMSYYFAEISSDVPVLKDINYAAGLFVPVFYMAYCCTNIVIRKDCVRFMLSLQEIHRETKELQNGSDSKYIILSYCFCFGPISFNVFSSVLRGIFHPDWTWARSVLSFFSMVFDVDLLYLVLVVVLLSDNIGLLIKALSKHEFTATRLISEHNDIQRKFRSEHLVKRFKKVLGTFQMTVTVFQMPILLHTTKTFIQSLLYLQTLIIFIKFGSEKHGTKPYSILLFTIWLAKELFMKILLSVTCEKFYSKISEAEAACVDLIENQVDVSARRMAKNVIRLCTTKHEKFQACGMFTVDATLPLRLAGLVTTYCIVLLQFAFL